MTPPLVSATANAPAPSTSPVVDHRVTFRRRSLVSDALVTALWMSGAVAASLFLATGGAAGFASVPDAVTSVGIVSGLVGSDFVLVMLVLAARIPFLDRTIGHDRAIATHRRLGKPALYLLLAHAALLILGYALSSGVDVVAETISLWNTPDFPLAFIGLGLFVVVVISSLVAVRRRFSYEVWHGIHLVSYAAVAVAIPHQLSAGAILAENSIERVYWITLYAVAFGAIGTYRFIVPAVASLRHRLRVSHVETIAPGVRSIHLTGTRLDSLNAAGGQFFVWRFWSRGTWWHAHPFSLSAVPGRSTLRITVRDLGSGSRSLGSLRPGTRVSIEGPYGLFTEAARTAPQLAIIAAGVGVTPVRALLEHASVAPGETTVLLRASTPDDAYLWEEMADLARLKGAALYAMVGPRAGGSQSWMTREDARRGVTLTSIFPDLLNSDLYICGPSAWIAAVEAEALASGLPSHQIHAERFDW